METIRGIWRQDGIPRGVRILTLATSIRWIGWGVAESLIPIFLFKFATSYAETGLLSSAYDVAFIIALPIVGILADRMRATTIVLAGLWLYVIVGTGYALAGVTGMVAFVIVARLVNGVGYALDAVGRETYFRRHVSKTNLAAAFGYFDTVADFWWIAAALFGAILVKYFSIGNLLFLIAPAVLVAIAILVKFRKTEPAETFSKEEKLVSAKTLVREFTSWDNKLKLVTFLNFWISFASATVAFFLPIQVYVEGANYSSVILMGVIMTIPSLMGWGLGRVFDRKGVRVFGYGLAALAMLLACLAFANAYIVQVAIGFAFGIVIELLWVGSEKLMTVYTKSDHFGRVDGIVRSIDDMGSLAGPLIAGIVIDAAGTHVAYGGLAALMVILAIGFTVATKYAKQG